MLRAHLHLQNFISDIRAAQNKEQEQRRVEKELAKIREKFTDDKSLSGEGRCWELQEPEGVWVLNS